MIDVLPSPESPVKPNASFVLPLPTDSDEEAAATTLLREAVAPVLRWQVGPAMDRAALAGGAPRRMALELYRALIDAKGEGGRIHEQAVMRAFKDVCGVDVGEKVTDGDKLESRSFLSFLRKLNAIGLAKRLRQNARMMVVGYGLDPRDPSTVEQLVVDIKGGLSPNRLEVVREVYDLVSARSTLPTHFVVTSGVLFSPHGHPRVRSGETSADRLSAQFAAAWAANARDDGAVERVEWEYCHAGIASAFDDDEAFEKMMVGCWPAMRKGMGGAGWRASDGGHLGDDAGRVAWRSKKKLVTKIRKLETLESRTFRTALDLCLIRRPPPSAPPAQQPLFSRPYLRAVIAELYELLECGLNVSADESGEDEQMLESIYRRVLKESGNGRGGIPELEWALRSALRRECNFLEYLMVAKTADLQG
ncbi:hypothetical protein HKX48_005919 [Thoreauomyces humboldtii]|nr:hypothetical protein HKX48_005919 [Thoreauomyces humboldtii]